MAYYIDENEEVHQYRMYSPTSIILDNGRVVADDNSSSGRMFAMDPVENPILKKVDGVWYYRGPRWRMVNKPHTELEEKDGPKRST